MADASHTTAVLIHRIRGGDETARTALVARIEPLLKRFAKGRLPSVLRHDQDTVDLLQVTWLKVVDRLEFIECQGPGALFAYLRTVLVNTLRESLRRFGREPDRADAAAMDDLPADGSSVEDWLAWQQMLAGLDEELRLLLIMRFEFGMSFVEIAEELGTTSDAVRMKVNRAIHRFAEAADRAT